jgi:hypothetical protein
MIGNIWFRNKITAVRLQKIAPNLRCKDDIFRLLENSIVRMSDVGEKLHLGAQEGADAGDVDSALMWRPHNTEVREPSMIHFLKNILLGDFFIFFVLYSTLLHLPPLRFHCADGLWDRTQDRCNWCIGSQTL